VKRACVALVCLAGFAHFACATVYTLSPDRVEGNMCEIRDGPKSWPRIFSGVLADGYCIGHDQSFQAGFFCLVDVPLSFVGDVLVSPYTAYQQIAHGNYRARPVNEISREIRRRNRESIEAALELCRKDQERGIYNCPSMIAPDGTVLVPLEGGPSCPEPQ
jgi:hypothetical protein